MATDDAEKVASQVTNAPISMMATDNSQVETAPVLTEEEEQEANMKQSTLRVKCTICNKDYRKYYLDCHMATHSAEKPFECDICHKRFGQKFYLMKHLKIHVEEKTFECTVCSRMFHYKTALQYHMMRHTGEKPHQCMVCKKTFRLMGSLRRHRVTHEKPYRCSICGMGYSNQNSCTRHEELHRDEDKAMHYCKVCCEKFLTVEDLESHSKTHDTARDDQEISGDDSTNEMDIDKSAALDEERSETDSTSSSKLDSEEQNCVLSELPYSCTICAQKCLQPDDLTRHLATHAEEDSGSLDVSFPRKTVNTLIMNNLNLQDVRIKDDHKAEANDCLLCNLQCLTLWRFGQHLKTHGILEPFQCSICTRSFEFKAILDSHMKMHSGKSCYECPVCYICFSMEKTLKKHSEIHTDSDVIHKCTFCDKTFKVAAQLEQHMLVHSVGRQYKCTVCGRSYSHKGTLQKHLRTHSDNPDRFPCTMCKKVYGNRSGLNRHMLTHSGVRLHQCTECDMSFSLKQYLVRHMKVHTGHKPFECAVCQRRFPAVGQLIQHVESHSSNKHFKCLLCGQGYDSNRGLTTHMNTHTYQQTEIAPFEIKAENDPQPRQEMNDQKIFKCFVCDEYFASKDEVTDHVKLHHVKKDDIKDVKKDELPPENQTVIGTITSIKKEIA